MTLSPDSPIPSTQPIGILGAMTEEIESLRPLLERAAPAPYGLLSGQLHGRAVLLGHSGIGKVNAAAAAARLLTQGVGQVVFTGVAGGLQTGLAVGDIVVSRDLVQHDVDVTALGYALGTVPGEAAAWEACPQLAGLALEAARAVLAEEGAGQAVLGRVASGDQFIAGAAAERLRAFEAACAEMEGAAVAQVCAQAGVPFVAIRSLSDSADGGAAPDYREFMPRMAERAARVVSELLRRLPA